MERSSRHLASLINHAPTGPRYQRGNPTASGIPALALIPRDETLLDGPTMAERFRQQLPHAQVELVDDSNHLTPIDQPQVVTEQLTKFLASVQGVATSSRSGYL